MIASKLPSVLHHPRGSISMERALKQIKDLLESAEGTGAVSDRMAASLDDIDTMLKSLDRG